MRISDWSSDVCSSDLSAVIRINLHIIGRLEKHTEFRCEAVEIRLAAPLGIQAIFDLPLTAGMNTADDQSETIDGLDAELAIAVDGARRLTGVCCKSRSEEHTSELQSLIRISYAVCCLKIKEDLSS